MSPSKPGGQLPCLPLLDHLYKALSQLVEFLEIGMSLADALKKRALVSGEPARL